MKTMKKIPNFKSEREEAEFWSKADSTEYVNWKNAGKVVFPNLKPSLKTISLRLPEILLADLKMLANKKDVPYQTLLKTFLADRIEKEMGVLG
jgi:predicted DNA binding CopG/RHH family protein